MKKKNRHPRPDVNHLRKDFEVFSQGVERLEELRKELNTIHHAGYEKEVLSIRSKLKNVSYIPEIEKEMRTLKDKIRGRYKSKPNCRAFNRLGTVESYLRRRLD